MPIQAVESTSDRADPNPWHGLESVSPTVRGSSAPRCPVDFALDVVGDRRKVLLLWHLFWGARSYGELMRLLEGVSKKNLRHELVNLERSGLVRRVILVGSNRRAEYMLSAFGETLKPLLATIYDWGLVSQVRRPRLHSSTTARD